MEEAEVIFYFDYVDPACYLLDQALRALAPDGVSLARRPFELRRPPLPPIDPGSEAWRSRCRAVQRGTADYGLEISIPGLMPWSRKAHELYLHARTKGCCEAVHSALFRAFFERKADIGRIDVLIALAEEMGLDPTEARAVLDVDRYAAEVEDMRDAALRSGVRDRPRSWRTGGDWKVCPTGGSCFAFFGRPLPIALEQGFAGPPYPPINQRTRGADGRISKEDGAFAGRSDGAGR